MSHIQDIFREHISQYKEKYRLSFEQAKAVKSMLNCRTAALGGHVSQCTDCGHEIIRYNSCRNRHCPTCQGLNKVKWVDQRSKDIINAPYFHVVFTIPEQLRSIIYSNQRLLYDLMFKVTSETLTELAMDEKHLGAQIGFFSILHTWADDLHYHPHIHTVVLGGGLTKCNEWRAFRKNFFVHVDVLSEVFRGKFLEYLRFYNEQRLLSFYGDTKRYYNRRIFEQLLDKCHKISWYSYSVETFNGPVAVMNYLGRYTHRIAISNNRIVSINNDLVIFNSKDYSTVTMKAVEFIRRFLMHILPSGFVKIRYYGLLANRNKKTKLTLSRILTQSPLYSPKYAGLSILEIMSLLLEVDVTLCPACSKGTLKPKLSLHGTVP